MKVMRRGGHGMARLKWVLLLALVGLLYRAEAAWMARQARAITGEAPYCLQVPDADGDGYRQAGSWQDMGVWQARGSGGLHHAVLVVGPPAKAELYHWSYFHQRFEAGSHMDQPVYCAPRRGFLDPMRPPLDDGRLHVFLAGRSFAIPKAYRPRMYWANHTGLSLEAPAPDFLPLPDGTPRNPRGVTVWFEPMDKLVVSRPGVHHLRVRTQQGHAITDIACLGDEEASTCVHDFEADGWHYDFSHDREDLPRWEEMERRLAGLVRSFVVPAPSGGAVP